MELGFMLTQSIPGAVEFLPQQVLQEKASLACEKSFFENFLVIRFVLNCLEVHYDTLRYPGMCRLMLFED